MDDIRVNQHGSDWLTLKRWDEEQIASFREELERLDVAPERAHQLRGMIHILREQVAYVEPPQKREVETIDYGRS